MNLFVFFRGPQTIEDLQQKLVQLTSQPSELAISGTPPSHPATPHQPCSYDAYMQTLQQKLASISNTGAPHVLSQAQSAFEVCALLIFIQPSSAIPCELRAPEDFLE